MADILTFGNVAAGALGSLAVVLEWAVDPVHKTKCQEAIERRLYWFRYTTLRNFGKNEIECTTFAVAKKIGAFNSVRRWAIVGFMLFAGLLICGIRGDLAYLEPSWSEAVRLALSMVALNISLSLTIALSRAILHLPYGATIAGTFALLLIHTALLFLWRPVASLAISLFSSLPDFRPAVGEGDLSWMIGQIFYYFEIMLNEMWKSLVVASTDPTVQHVASFLRWSIVEFPTTNDGVSYPSIIGAAEVWASMATQAIRIGLALLFLAGFIYVRVVRPPLVFFWAALSRSTNPVFAPPLSALAALVILVDRRDQIVDAIRGATRYALQAFG